MLSEAEEFDLVECLGFLLVLSFQQNMTRFQHKPLQLRKHQLILGHHARSFNTQHLLLVGFLPFLDFSLDAFIIYIILHLILQNYSY